MNKIWKKMLCIYNSLEFCSECYQLSNSWDKRRVYRCDSVSYHSEMLMINFLDIVKQAIGAIV